MDHIINIVEIISRERSKSRREEELYRNTFDRDGNLVTKFSQTKTIDLNVCKNPCINIDVIRNSRVVEAWRICLETSNQDDNMCDDIDIVVLSQSVYGFIQKSPLTELVKEGMIKKEEFQLNVCISEERQEEPKELKLHEFNPAYTSFGIVKIQSYFLYDSQSDSTPKQLTEERKASRPSPISSRLRSTGSPLPSPSSMDSILEMTNLKYFGREATNGSTPINIARKQQRTNDESTYKPSPHPEITSPPLFKSSFERIGSLLGSYEESILNGRMSTCPSKPIEFYAEIGVFGKGKCRQSLKCPPHIHLKFSACFYTLKEEEAPSPYVGTIDLENLITDPTTNSQLKHPGLYEIPRSGMLQVIIKNQDKTVVKIFLVSYDLSDMTPMTKTFIRQKQYSVEESNAFRYAIHVPFVCNHKKKIYIKRQIRVVFSHRVPDGSEKMKTVSSKPDHYTPIESYQKEEEDEEIDIEDRETLHPKPVLINFSNDENM